MIDFKQFRTFCMLPSAAAATATGQLQPNTLTTAQQAAAAAQAAQDPNQLSLVTYFNNPL